MHNEINTAVEFIVRLLRSSEITVAQIEVFKASLKTSLSHKFASHWSPNEPMKGNAYRSILVTQGLIDPVLAQSAKAAGLASLNKRWFPSELIIWIDPLDVTYRIGDHGSVAALPIELSATKSLQSTSVLASNGPTNKEASLPPSPLPNPLSNKFLAETGSTATKDSPMPIEVR